MRVLLGLECEFFKLGLECECLLVLECECFISTRM